MPRIPPLRVTGFTPSSRNISSSDGLYEQKREHVSGRMQAPRREQSHLPAPITSAADLQPRFRAGGAGPGRPRGKIWISDASRRGVSGQATFLGSCAATYGSRGASRAPADMCFLPLPPARAPPLHLRRPPAPPRAPRLLSRAEIEARSPADASPLAPTSGASSSFCP